MPLIYSTQQGWYHVNVGTSIPFAKNEDEPVVKRSFIWPKEAIYEVNELLKKAVNLNEAKTIVYKKLKGEFKCFQ